MDRAGLVGLSIRNRKDQCITRERPSKKCVGYKYNCFDVDTGENYWITGPKKQGGDKLYGGKFDIDPDARIEYWTKIRKKPENIDLSWAE